MRDVIVVDGVWKKFHLYHYERTKAFAEIFIRGLKWMKPLKHFWALKNINFKVKEGQTLGIIGANGSGKSTLLRLIGGVLHPDKGSIQIHGRLGFLLELGTGFHPDLTGRENVYIYGVISGLTRREVTQCFESIVAFAELETFIDKPLRSYSSGMQMRLAFSVAIHIEPEIFLIDEVLTVGDLAFQYKCLDKISEFKEKGCALILVSHDMAQIQQHCDNVLWLRAGCQIEYGETKEIVSRYFSEMSAETRKRTPVNKHTQITSTGSELRINENRFGSMDMEVEDVRLLDENGLMVEEINSGDQLTIEICFRAPEPIKSPIFSVTINDSENQNYFDTNTATSGLVLPILKDKGRIFIHLERLDLNSGMYFIDIGVYENSWAYAYDYQCHVHKILIHSKGHNKGILASPFKWEFEGKKV